MVSSIARGELLPNSFSKSSISDNSINLTSALSALNVPTICVCNKPPSSISCAVNTMSSVKVFNSKSASSVIVFLTIFEVTPRKTRSTIPDSKADQSAILSLNESDN